MKDYLTDIFYDTLLSFVTKKYSTTINDSQRDTIVRDTISRLKGENAFTVQMTQAIFDKKGLNSFCSANVDGKSVFALTKTGMFGKAKIRYFITRKKEGIDGAYLDQIYDELRRQAQGENVFGSSEFKAG